MAKTILNSILQAREHYYVSVRLLALLVERSECNKAIGRTQAQLEKVLCGVQHAFNYVINLLSIQQYFKTMKV